MSGEPAHRRALRLRQAAHCLLPSLEPSLPIHVRLGPSRRIGGAGSVCCGHDYGIWISRIRGNTHEVAVLQSILGRSPRVPSIGAFKVPVACGRVNPPGCKRMRHRCVRVVRTAANTITPGAPAVERAHERASLDRDEHTIRDAHIGFDPPHMMRAGAWGKTPGVSRRERAQSGEVHPAIAAIVGAKHRTWFGTGIDETEPVSLSRVTHINRGDYRVIDTRSGWLPIPAAVAASEETVTRSSAVHLSRSARVDRDTCGR